MYPPRMHPPRPPRRAAPPWRPALAFCLTSALAAPSWLAPPPARAQTSTPVYGSDTAYVDALTPPLRTAGDTRFNSGDSLVLGLPGQYQTTYGAAYDPDPVDVSQGFVSRLDASGNGSNGFIFVVKNPAASDYIETPPNPDVGSVRGLGAYGLSKCLGVAFITYAPSPSNRSGRHYKEVEVYVTDVDGRASVLADVPNLDIDSSTDVRTGGGILQVRYLPRFSTLDVYIGPRLITRVANVDLVKLGVAPDGQAELGVTSGVPGIQRGSNSSNTYDLPPAYLNHFSLGNQLVFGTGFGPNFYEDRFPFLTTGQSVWGTGSDSVRYQKFLGAKSNGRLNSKTIGVDY